MIISTSNLPSRKSHREETNTPYSQPQVPASPKSLSQDSSQPSPVPTQELSSPDPSLAALAYRGWRSRLLFYAGVLRGLFALLQSGAGLGRIRRCNRDIFKFNTRLLVVGVRGGGEGNTYGQILSASFRSGWMYTSISRRKAVWYCCNAPLYQDQVFISPSVSMLTLVSNTVVPAATTCH